MDNSTLILLLIPILLVQVILLIINLLNLRKKAQTKYLNKTIWLLIILLTSITGNVVYLLLEGINDDSN